MLIEVLWLVLEVETLIEVDVLLVEILVEDDVELVEEDVEVVVPVVS